MLRGLRTPQTSTPALQHGLGGRSARYSEASYFQEPAGALARSEGRYIAYRRAAFAAEDLSSHQSRQSPSGSSPARNRTLIAASHQFNEHSSALDFDLHNTQLAVPKGRERNRKEQLATTLHKRVSQPRPSI